MDLEKIELDKLDYDYLILGTDFSESIASAVLSSRGHSCINIDCDFLYSGTLKALNLREVSKWKESLSSDFKESLVENLKIEFNEKYFDSLDDAITKVGFRAFYIDMDPKLIFSTSKSTKDLICIGVDNYTTFKSVKNVSISENGIFAKVPVSKSLITKCKFLSLKEKKNFIGNFEVIQKFIQNNLQEKNRNSVNEFEKEIYENSKVKKGNEFAAHLSENHSVLFSKLLEGTSNKTFEDLVRYSICNRLIKSEEDPMTVQELFNSFQRFVKSIGGHDVYPYLYSSYGVGDLTQVFSRIAALHGAVFLINPLFDLKSIERRPDQSFKCVVMQGPHMHEIKVKNLIVGRQFQSKVALILKGQKRDPGFLLKRIIAVCKNLKPASEHLLEVPFVGVVPERQELLFNENPVRIFISNANTQTADGNFCVNILFRDNLKESFDCDVFVDKLLGILDESFGTKFERMMSIEFGQITDDHKQFWGFEDNVIFTPNFETELTVDAYFEAAWKFAREKNLVKDEKENLIRKVVEKSEEELDSGNKEEGEILSRLEKFKFSDIQ